MHFILFDMMLNNKTDFLIFGIRNKQEEKKQKKS